MLTTLDIDDELLRGAQEILRLDEKAAVVNAALRSIVEREAARQLAARGGTDPTATAGPRRRSSVPRKGSRGRK